MSTRVASGGWGFVAGVFVAGGLSGKGLAGGDAFATNMWALALCVWTFTLATCSLRESRS